MQGTLHVEWYGPQNTRFDGIAWFALKSSSAEIRLKEDAIEDTGYMERLPIAFNLSAYDYEDLKATLYEVFAEDTSLEGAEECMALALFLQRFDSPGQGCVNACARKAALPYTCA
ncbi:hypothetical protein CTI10_012770 [Delftia acidovorans]|uniref:Uncharacterized protein n=1 Tax=Chryseobacterium sp. B5 TaxID=2050562 RepID=A0A2G7T9B7_9FLAO|nr:hypothetical protein CTI10_012770 [Delftia acidovorans]